MFKVITSDRSLEEAHGPVKNFEGPRRIEVVAEFVDKEKLPFGTAEGDDAVLFDAGDKIVIAPDCAVKNGKCRAYIFVPVRIGASRALQTVAVRNDAGKPVGGCRLACVEALDEVKAFGYTAIALHRSAEHSA